MGKFFNSADSSKQYSERELLQNKYHSARTSLLAMIAFTVVNIVLLFIDSSSYFLFSLYVPYILVFMGLLFTGRLPEISNMEEFAGFEILPDVVLTVMVVLASIIVLLHLISWIFSKKNRVGWLIFALVLFSIDTVFMFLMQGISVDTIIDVVFHVWVIVSLANGIRAHKKLQALPPEEVIVETTGEVMENPTEEVAEKASSELCK